MFTYLFSYASVFITISISMYVHACIVVELHYAILAGLEFTMKTRLGLNSYNPHASALPALGLKACATLQASGTIFTPGY